MFTPKLLRRRWVLALIFTFSLFYFAANIYKQSQFSLVEDTRPEPTHRPPQIQWDDVKVKLNFDDVHQSQGYICEREHILPGGCCDTKHPSTKRFICDSCQKSGCCEIYEHCVSCCLQPEKQSLLRKILGQAQDSFQHLFASVTDHFELCLAKCRTSSQSVQHENSYRNPRAKYCYGENPPDIQPVV
ncbi:hypothetical protein LSH36_247g03144 [Paralvinella palmiformis]|uniref:SREBP regulating gene protein n=1 Tax=Paralvinella palmiformis TaxID=53620 RepID=A0AAD9JL20_9ANNE|nr:hypothetical protein LSH36_247g03144 [Paralvinella palmiformis]